MKAAMDAMDAAKLKAMYTDTYSHTHGSGKVDGRDARIVSLLTGDPVIEDAPITEMAVRVHGDTSERSQPHEQGRAKRLAFHHGPDRHAHRT